MTDNQAHSLNTSLVMSGETNSSLLRIVIEVRPKLKSVNRTTLQYGFLDDLFINRCELSQKHILKKG